MGFERSRMRSQLGVAVIGCGFQGSIHAANIAASERARLLVCADAVPSAAEALAAESGADRWTGTIDEVWADPSVDAVVIATTTHTHHALALEAARHGKHILLEKPMALTIDECLEIERVVADAGVGLMLGYKFRYCPAVIAAKEAVPDPRVLVAQTLYDPAPPGITGWVNDRALSGGRLVSSLVHSIDLLRFLAGSEVVVVSGDGIDVTDPASSASLTEPSTAVANLRFANGAIASLVHGSAGTSSVLSTWSFQSTAPGVNATIHAHGRRLSLHRAGGDDPPDIVEDVDDPFRAGTAPLFEAFAAAVVDGTPMSPDGRDGTVSLHVARCLEAAIATGLPQEVPPLEG